MTNLTELLDDWRARQTLKYVWLNEPRIAATLLGAKAAFWTCALILVPLSALFGIGYNAQLHGFTWKTHLLTLLALASCIPIGDYALTTWRGFDHALKTLRAGETP